MLDRISGNVRGEVEPIVQRWNGFVGKVEARLGEIVAEADEGLSALIEQHPTDHGTMGAALSAVQARFHGLGPKVDDAFEKIEESLEEVIDGDDRSEADQRALYALRDALQEQQRGLLVRIERAHQELEMRKNAEWAERLLQLAEREAAEGVACSQCGGPIAVQIRWRASQVTCAHCGAVNDVTPGVAAGYFYQGIGVHALSHRAAWHEWLAEQDALARFDARRHPTSVERDAHLAAARAYHTKYYQVGMQLHPELVADLGQAVEAKLAHYHQWDQPLDRMKRDLFARLVDAASRGDANGVRALASNPGVEDVDRDDCAEALEERGFHDAAAMLRG